MPDLVHVTSGFIVTPLCESVSIFYFNLALQIYFFFLIDSTESWIL